MLVLSLLGVTLAACSTTPNQRADDPRRATGEALFGASNSRDIEVPAWTIFLLPVDPTRVDAESLLKEVQAISGLRRARLAERGGSMYIGLGQYDDPTSRDAQADFTKVKAIVIDGQRPFARSFMVPPSARPVDAATSEADLRTVRYQFGRDALYSLQIGVYGRDDGTRPSGRELAEFRSAAESAAAALRGNGELAFFLHGPINSIVTVGVFGPRDYDTTVIPPLESDRLKEARERHPNNMLNGQGITERFHGAGGTVVEQLQGSELIVVPDR